ncbi:DNA/RNA polymerases superfamily protein [Gossypium australe]|uniref:DNA/RNA polymerases superfamily protein n=1 Tax=Gossypium australe TaxID=47621 RepID=A0A5B6WTT8_9ROSI|nr:DNA/RNA polymerases superfamily protein [Gossypium australe]
MSQGAEPVRTGKPSIDKIRKHGEEEFRATVDDDPERAEFWLKNTIGVSTKRHSLPLVEYHNFSGTRENITWEFFQTEFRKKHVSQRFLDQKKKEFLAHK